MAEYGREYTEDSNLSNCHALLRKSCKPCYSDLTPYNLVQDLAMQYVGNLFNIREPEASSLTIVQLKRTT